MKRSGRFGSKYSQKGWDGKKRLYHKGFRTFGTGLLERVSTILDAYGYSVELEEESHVSSPITLPMPGVEWTPRPYQRKAILSGISSGRGMFKVATGGGKTVIAGHLMKALGERTIFLVHTKDLLYQAHTTFVLMFGEANVGQVGDGIINVKPITVCTIQTAARALEVKYEKDAFAEGDEDGWRDKDTDHTSRAIKEMFESAGMVMMDECHRVAAQTASDVVTAIPANYRFGFSASPWRDDGADLVLEAVFGEIIVDINASVLIDLGYLVKPIIRIRKVPAARFDKKDTYSTIYEQYIVENVQRNTLVTADAYHKMQRGMITMILVRHIKHGLEIQQQMRDLLATSAHKWQVPFLSGKDDSKLRNSVLADMRAGLIPCLVATTIADEGLDIKPLAGLVLAGGGKSSTRALQRIGRVLRTNPGKTVAEVTDFEDNARFLYDHSRARVKIYESEPRFIVTDI